MREPCRVDGVGAHPFPAFVGDFLLVLPLGTSLDVDEVHTTPRCVWHSRYRDVWVLIPLEVIVVLTHFHL